jgi:hypothetical protein
MSLPSIPDLNPSRYRWHPSPSRPRTVQRLANGTETWVGIKSENAKGQYDFYINTALRMNSVWISRQGALPPLASPIKSLSLSGLAERFAVALLQIEHDEIACEAVWPDEAGPPWITCIAPGTTGEALERARGMVETRVGKIDGFGLRGEVEKERRRKDVAEPAPSDECEIVACC